MTDKWKMDDVVILLPGIAGSVLEKNGKPLWDPGVRTLLDYVASQGQSITQMRDDHRDDPEYDDGVRATRLLSHAIIPGLTKFKGYGELTAWLLRRFELKAGIATDDPSLVDSHANFFEFPYDWRRDNRITAMRLKQFIETHLPKFREATKNPDAKIILLCHSMGGLVARYYVEVLMGFEYTRVLVTFGTPHRGSVMSLGFLANGYRKFGKEFSELTATLRTFTSVYQLLPRYPAVLDTDSQFRRVGETLAAIHNVDRERALAAYEFYAEIDRAYANNMQSEAYDVSLTPVFGWGQETMQSAILGSDGTLNLSTQLPPDVDAVFANGDGTVPRVSAIPIELNSMPMRWWPINQLHGMLQSDARLLTNLEQMLAAYQGDLRLPARGGTKSMGEPSIELSMDDIYAADECVSFRVRVDTERHDIELKARIENVTNGKISDIPLSGSGAKWEGAISSLPAGTYRLKCELMNPPATNQTVSDIFEVSAMSLGQLE